MKIWCDVCDKEEASVFCLADEAALCYGCDHRVHDANKVAGKHLRLNLVNPSFKESPLCDICQERRALLFCQEDRAILCRECDLPIHKANEYTKNHNRFLLTGVKLSPPLNIPSPSSASCCDATHDNKFSSPYSSVKQASSSTISNNIFSSNSTTFEVDDSYRTSDNGSISTSSISEYLMETLPGWRVEDFLEPSLSATAANFFCKTCDNFLPFGDQDLESNNMGSFSSKDLAIWVPDVSPQVPFDFPQYGALKGLNESTEPKNLEVGRKWDDDGFKVPHRPLICQEGQTLLPES